MAQNKTHTQNLYALTLLNAIDRYTPINILCKRVTLIFLPYLAFFPHQLFTSKYYPINCFLSIFITVLTCYKSYFQLLNEMFVCRRQILLQTRNKITNRKKVSSAIQCYSTWFVLNHVFFSVRNTTSAQVVSNIILIFSVQ